MNGRLARSLRLEARDLVARKRSGQPAARRRATAKRVYRGLKREYVRLRSGR